jgi:predicted lipoprotein
MKRSITYIPGIAAILLLLFFSLDIQKLDRYRATHTSASFDAGAYAREVWENEIPQVVLKAPELNVVVDMLHSDPERAFATMGRKLGISRTWYFMARGEGVVESAEEEYLQVITGNSIRIELATSFIFGNAVRDGSGVVDIDDFLNMTDFNNVSIAINKRIKEEVVPKLRELAVPGTPVEFAGAFEIGEDHISLSPVRIIPVSIKLADEKGR